MREHYKNMNYQVLDTIKQAAQRHLVLKLVYTEKDGTSKGWRYVEPYSFSHDNGSDGLFAWDIDKQGIRRFSLDRIDQTEVTNQSYEPRYPIEII